MAPPITSSKPRLAAVKPVDVIDEMFTVDVVSSEFEVLCWPRLKLSLIRKRAIEGLEECLVEELQYDHYCDYFVDDLTEILEDNLPEDQVNSAQALAQQYALNETNAVIMVSKVLAIAGLNMDRIRRMRGSARSKILCKPTRSANRTP